MSLRRRPCGRAPLAAACAVALAIAFAPGGVAAAPTPPFDKLDPNVLRAIRTGLVGPMQKGPPTPGRASALVELTVDANGAAIAELERLGARAARPSGVALAYRRFVPVDLDEAAALALAASPIVRRVQHASTRGPMPLDQSAALIHLAEARGARPALDLMTGEGVLIGDVDTNIDPFHPTFFRGDAGYYDWIDVDGDGVFTPGVDAIDLDRDGRPGPGETGLLVFADTINFSGDEAGARSSAFDPSVDWIYLDTNGNGSRDFGAPDFDDSVPAFGEPLFVPDDVNKNGRVDAGERFVRLGTSKIQQVYVHLEAGFGIDHVYTRGVDLATLPVDVTHDQLYGYPDALHATGVHTILAGDVPLVGRRWVGMAPGVDVILAWDVESTGDGLPIKGVTWALMQKPDVMLYELAPWTGSPLDGTDALSSLIDAAYDADHGSHTCPTGDQGSAHKHAHADAAAGSASSLSFDLPATAKLGTEALSYVEVSLDVRGGVASSAVLTGPGGDSIDLLSPRQASLSTGAIYQATVQMSPRGTELVDVILYSPDAAHPLPIGAWTATVTAGASALSVDAYVMDDKSSWAVGAAWDASVSTDASTVGLPSVADHCIAVGAHPDHVVDPNEPWYDIYYDVYDVPAGFRESQGQVRAYSPRGPRIDLVQKPDLLAPDNPWVAAEFVGDGSTPYGAFRVFGGTSGASPHVTGVAALLAQAGVRGDDARDALRAGAAHDSVTGAVWNPDYGYGRLDASAALGGATAAAPPTVALRASTDSPRVGEPLELIPTATSPGGAGGLEVKWDDGYDGTWDTAYGPVAPRRVSSSKTGSYPYKVRARDAGGRVAEAVLWLDFTTPSADVTSAAATGGAALGGGSEVQGGGCGCRAASDSQPAAALPLVLAAAAALARRRRRARRLSPPPPACVESPRMRRPRAANDEGAA